MCFFSISSRISLARTKNRARKTSQDARPWVPLLQECEIKNLHFKNPMILHKHPVEFPSQTKDGPPRLSRKMRVIATSDVFMQAPYVNERNLSFLRGKTTDNNAQGKVSELAFPEIRSCRAWDRHEHSDADLSTSSEMNLQITLHERQTDFLLLSSGTGNDIWWKADPISVWFSQWEIYPKRLWDFADRYP